MTADATKTRNRPQYVSLSEAAQRVGVDRRTVRAAIAKGDLPACPRANSVIRDPRAALDELAACRGRGLRRRCRGEGQEPAEAEADARPETPALAPPVRHARLGLTRGQLRREAKAAVTTKYGPLTQQQRTGVQEAKAYQRDIGTYYDDYLRHVQQSADRVREAGQRATGALQNLQGGVTGLAAADLTGIQQPANQDAAARGATAGDVTGMASNAAAVRQALIGSFGAQQARINQGAEDYATHKADVVAPSQRLQGLAMAQGRTRQARQDLAADDA